MSWITLVAVLVAWSLIGLGVAYLFGRFIHGAEFSGDASDLAPPVLSYCVARSAQEKRLRARQSRPKRGARPSTDAAHTDLLARPRPPS